MPDHNPGERVARAEVQVAEVFERAGWRVEREPAGKFAPDMAVYADNAAYAVEVKVASEGRSDRLLPLLAMAVLRAQRAAKKNQLPLAIVFAPKIRAQAADQLLAFGRDNAPDVAVGVLVGEGLRRFSEPALQVLESEPDVRVSPALPKSAREAPHLFSDLNQWMLKVLLAPEFEIHLLGGPRGRYHNASQLAQAAQVSVMSAFRLVQQLKDEATCTSPRHTCNSFADETCSRAGRRRATEPAAECTCAFDCRATARGSSAKYSPAGARALACLPRRGMLGSASSRACRRTATSDA
jgi:hypothetical protein